MTPSRALDGDAAGHETEIRIDRELRAKGARPELRSREVQVVVFLELVIGKFVAGRHADTARVTRRVDHVHAGDLRLFATVFRVTRHQEFLAVGAQHGTVAFVEPLGRRSEPVGFRPPAFETPTEHPHAVGKIFVFFDPGTPAPRNTRFTRGDSSLRFARLGMHPVAAGGAAEMRETCSAHETSRRLGMVDRHQQTPRRRTGVNRIVLERLCARTLVHQRRQRHAVCNRALGECQHRVGALDQAQRRLFDASHAPCRTVQQLNEPGRRSHLHLMLQPMLGRCTAGIARPAISASRAARRSRPVTGMSLPGRLSSSWPR